MPRRTSLEFVLRRFRSTAPLCERLRLLEAFSTTTTGGCGKTSGFTKCLLLLFDDFRRIGFLVFFPGGVSGSLFGVASP